MSYRDLRSFTEMMQELGYPRLISMENFRTPNFPLVAEILVWLVKRFDPDTEISRDINNERERVTLIRIIAQMLVVKANLKLNTKKLYQADGYAVKEMLKVTNLLHNSLQTAEFKHKEAEDERHVSFVPPPIKAEEVNQTIQLVGAIVSSGATVFDLLGKEAELRELRSIRASKHLEMNQVEQAVRDSIAVVTKEIENTKQSMESIIANDTTLNVKIEKKKSDLERYNKRLQTLKKIRPAFMEEFEKLEEELKELYSDYIIKCRNLAHLESILEQTVQTEQKRTSQRLAFSENQVENLKEEETSDNAFTEDFDSNFKPLVRPQEASRPVFFKDLKEKDEKSRKAFGNMTGEQDSESLVDSDSDLLLDGEITEDDIEIGTEAPREVSDDDF